MNYFLALETSNTITSIALFQDSQLLFNQELALDDHKNKYLFTTIERVLKFFNLKVIDLKALILSSGPGSYTGLRIGTALSKALCFAGQIPLIAINTLEALAKQAHNQAKNFFDLHNYHFLALLDARRNNVYAACYNHNLVPAFDMELLSVNSDKFKSIEKPCFIFGDGARKWQNYHHTEYVFLAGLYPQAKYLIDLGLKKYKAESFENLAYFAPNYLKDFIPGKAKPKLKLYS